MVAIDKLEASLKEPKTWGLAKKYEELIESNANRVKIREKKIYDAKKCLLEYELAHLYPSSEEKQAEIENLQQEIKFYELKVQREKIVQTLVKILIGCNYSYPAKKVNREI